jgi:GT2 family glycosyltransferase
VESVRQSHYTNYHVLVLDNASPDGSGELLATQIGAEFVQLSTNSGYAGGNNIGIQIALERGADYVLIVNPDVRLPPDALTCYVNILEADHGIGALNGVQVGADGRTIDSKFRTGILQPLGYKAEEFDCNALPVIFESPMLFGAAIMIPARTIRRVGGFDPLYFAYGEEIDLCRRMIFHGLRLVVTSKAPVVHLRTIEETEYSDFLLFLRIRGFYLAELKAPCGSMLLSLRRSLGDLCAAALGRPKPKFPFTHFPLKPKHALKAAAWLLWNFPAVRRHRNNERRGRCYV